MNDASSASYSQIVWKLFWRHLRVLFRPLGIVSRLTLIIEMREILIAEERLFNY